MKHATSRIILAVIGLVITAGLGNAQPASGVAGRWVWKAPARRNQPQTQFTIVIKRAGDKVSGTYSVDQFINGEWQGEDGNQTPFTGRIVRGGAEIEFDPDATVPGYEQNVVYKPPPDGRKPARALLILAGGSLRWQSTSGRIESVPARLTLRREPRPRR